MSTNKYYSPLILFVPISALTLALPFVVRFTDSRSSGLGFVNIPYLVWLLLCLGVFAALVEKLIRLYSVEVNAEGLSCVKWGRRRWHPWTGVVKAEWRPLVVRISFRTGKVDVNFLIVRDREEIVNRIVAGMRESGLAPTAILVPPLPGVPDRDDSHRP